MVAARNFAKAQLPRKGIFAEFCIKPPELMLLFALRDALREAGGGEGIFPSAIAGRMGVTAGHVTQVITSLEEKGLVGRSEDPTDRRRTMLNLTERGSRALQEAVDSYRRNYEGLLDLLGPEDTDKFVTLLERATRYITELRGADASEAQRRCD